MINASRSTVCHYNENGHVTIYHYNDTEKHFYTVIRYDTRCYFNVRSKADISQLNLPHGVSQQEAQLSPSDRAMRLVSSNLANYHAIVQKLLMRQVLTKPMV